MTHFTADPLAFVRVFRPSRVRKKYLVGDLLLKEGFYVKLPRVLLAVFLSCLTFGPAPTAHAAPNQSETLAFASAIDRSIGARASRSEARPVTRAVDEATTTTVTPPPSTTTTSTTPLKTSAPEPKVTASVATLSDKGGNQSVVQIALAQVGKRYVAGATGPNAFDCSGLVFYVFNQAGIHIPRLTSDGYYAKYKHVSRAELQPGDLIVSSGHIAIYIGNGQMVHASTPRGGVKRSPVGSAGTPFGYARI